MRIFVNDREITGLDTAHATLGEVAQALEVYVDPREVPTLVTVDGQPFSAGDEPSWARRSAAAVSRLELTTRSVPQLAAELRDEVAAALRCVAAKVEAAVQRFGRSDVRGGQQMLATAIEELRLTLVLDDQTAQLGGGGAVTSAAEVEALATELLAVQDRRDVAAMRALLADRLLPLLCVWGERATASAADGGASAAARLALPEP
ncbi:MAG: hypothetical protein AB1689_17170 [Thermodesulfobacteriota bacterium]